MDILQELLVQIDKFAQNEIIPRQEEDEEQGIFRPEIFKSMGDLGLCSLTLSEEQGGSGLGYGAFCKVLEQISRYSISYSVTLSVSCMVQGIINRFGNSDQKKTYIPKLADGSGIGAFCLSESHSGSDAASLKTTAKLEGDHYVLNGSKMWITSGGIAEVYVVMARTGGPGAKGISAFIVPKDTPGLNFGKKEKKMGWRASHTREVLFENCKIPKANLLLNEGEGFKVAMSALDGGRATIGAMAVGLAREAIEYATKYALERQQFNQPIFDFQGLQFLLAENATEIEAASLLVYEVARNLDNGIINSKLAAMAKLKATDVAMKASTDAVQVLGGVGYTSEYPVERQMRDAKVLQIVEGTNQIQKVVIARELKKELTRNS